MKIKFLIQNPTAYISIGIKSKKNFRSPNQIEEKNNLCYTGQQSFHPETAAIHYECKMTKYYKSTVVQHLN